MSEALFDPNSPEWWEQKARIMEQRGDERIRPDEFKAVAKRCVGGVVEIGSAFGHFSSFLPLETPYLGVDVSAHFTAGARARYPSRLFIMADIVKAAPHFRAAFGTAVALQVLEHFPDVRPLLEVFRSIARKRLVFSVPRQEADPKHTEADGHVSFWTSEKELVETMSPFGDLDLFEGEANHFCGILAWR